MTSKPGIPLNEPQPDHDINCGIDALRLGEDIGCTCGAEREARGIPLIDVELLVREVIRSVDHFMEHEGYSPTTKGHWFRDLIARLASESSIPEPDEAAAMRWLAANDLYAVTHIHESKDCAECWAGLPVEEGEQPSETYEQKQQRLRREEEDRL